MMKVYIKVGLVLFASLVVTLLLSMWTFSSQMVDFQISNQKQGLEKELFLLNNSIELQSQYSVQQLFHFASIEWAARKSSEKPEGIEAPLALELQKSDFLGVIQFVKSSLGSWTPKWGSVSQTILSSASTQYWKEFSEDFPWSRVKNDNVNWVRFLGPKREPFLAVMVKATVQNRTQLSSGLEDVETSPIDTVLIGVLPIRYFDKYSWATKGTELKAMVINDDGFAFLHPIQNYIGSNVKSLEVVERVLKSERPQGSFDYKGIKGRRFLSHFQKMIASNLRIVVEESASPESVLSASLVAKSFLYTLGIWALCLGAMVFIFYRMGHSFSELRGAVYQFIKGHPIAVTNSTGMDVEKLIQSLEDRRQQCAVLEREQESKSVPPLKTAEATAEFQLGLRPTYERMSKGLSQSLRGPLASIIGHVQLASGQVTGDVQKHFDIIKEEARKAREIVESLTAYSSSEQVEAPQRQFLFEAVKLAKNTVMQRISDDAVDWQENIPVECEVFVQIEMFQEVLVELFNNAIDAASESQTKVVRISALSSAHGTQLIVENSGVIAGELAKLTHPFYTTKEQSLHAGLGLVVIQSVMQSIQGDMLIEKSQLGGLEVTLSLPLIEKGHSLPNKIGNVLDGPLPVEVIQAPSDQGVVSAVTKLRNEDNNGVIVYEQGERPVSDDKNEKKENGSAKDVEADDLIVHAGRTSLTGVPKNKTLEQHDMTTEISVVESDESDMTVSLDPKGKDGLVRRAPADIGPSTPASSEDSIENSLLTRRAGDSVGPNTPQSNKDQQIEGESSLTQPIQSSEKEILEDDLELTQSITASSSLSLPVEDDLELTQSLGPIDSAAEEELDLTQNIGPFSGAENSAEEGSELDITQSIGSINEEELNMTRPIAGPKAKIAGTDDGVTEEVNKVSTTSSESAINTDGDDFQMVPPGMPLKKTVPDDKEDANFPPAPVEDLLGERTLGAEEGKKVTFPVEPKSDVGDSSDEEESEVKIRPPRLKE